MKASKSTKETIRELGMYERNFPSFTIGDTIAVSGIGGLGHLAIQYAKTKGHKVLAITHSPNKKELAQQLGADEVIIADKDAASTITALGGIDVLLHTGNASTMTTSLLPAMNPEGRIVIMGLSDAPIQVSPLSLIHKQLSIKGSMQNKRKDLIDILQLAKEKKIRPMIEVYPLNQINQVLEKLEQGTIRFRAVIKT